MKNKVEFDGDIAIPKRTKLQQTIFEMKNSMGMGENDACNALIEVMKHPRYIRNYHSVKMLDILKWWKRGKNLTDRQSDAVFKHVASHWNRYGRPQI